MRGRVRAVARRTASIWSMVHPWLVPAVLFGSFFAAYLATLTRHYTFDSVAYATQIRRFDETGQPGWLFHPHHLLFNPLGLFTWRLLSGLGLHADPLLAIQCMNAFAGACGVVVFYEMLRRGGFRLGVSRAGAPPTGAVLAFASAIVLGSSYGYWVCATDGRVNMPNLVAVIAFLGAAWGMAGSPNALQAAGMALVTVLAVGLHQSAGLLIPAGVASILVSHSWARKKLRLTAVYLVLTAVGIAVLYAGVGTAVKGFQDVQQLRNWALAYAEDGRWWSFDIKRNVLLDLTALWCVFVPTVEGAGRFVRGLAVSLGSIFVATGLLAGVLLRTRGARGAVREGARRRGAGSGRRRLTVLAVAALSYALFFTVWAPGYFVFWLPVAAAMIAAVAVVLSGRSKGAQAVAAVALLAVAGAAARISVPEAILPNTWADSNHDLTVSRALSRHAGPGDLVLATGVQPPSRPSYLEVYVPYFTRASLRTLSGDLKAARGKPDPVVIATRGIVQNRLNSGLRVIALAEYASPGKRPMLDARCAGAGSAPRRILEGYYLRPIKSNGAIIAYEVLPGAMAHLP